MTARPRSPEAERVRKALQRLVATDEWAVFIEYSRSKIENSVIDTTRPDAGALFVQHGRRSFHRELIENLSKRVSDDDRSADPS